jgi:hypothetical protein
MPRLPEPKKPDSPWSYVPEPGDPPSENELKVLYALARAQSATRTAFGPDSTEAICACWNHSGLQLSKEQLYGYVRRLEWKGCVYRFKRGHELTYSVTDHGRIRLVNAIHPEISEYGWVRDGWGAEDPASWTE